MEMEKKLKLFESYLRLRTYLLTQFNWTTQKEITEKTGLSGVMVRRICQVYPAGFVSSTSGYKLVKYANPAEVQECVASLISRSTKMARRAAALSGTMVYR